MPTSAHQGVRKRPRRHDAEPRARTETRSEAESPRGLREFGKRLAVALGLAVCLMAMLVVMGLAFTGRPGALFALPVLVIEGVIVFSLLLWSFGAFYTPLTRLSDTTADLLIDVTKLSVTLSWLFLATNVAVTRITSWHTVAYLAYTGLFAVIVAIIVAVRLMKGRIGWNVTRLLERYSLKRRQKWVRVPSRAAVYTLDLALDLAVLACFFAGATVLLASVGVVAYRRGAVPSNVDALAHYGWHLADEIPALKVTGTLAWKDPTAFVGVLSGVLVLLFKLVVVFPIVRYARALLTLSRSNQPVLAQAAPVLGRHTHATAVRHRPDPAHGGRIRAQNKGRKARRRRIYRR